MDQQLQALREALAAFGIELSQDADPSDPERFIAALTAACEAADAKPYSEGDLEAQPESGPVMMSLLASENNRHGGYLHQKPETAKAVQAFRDMLPGQRGPRPRARRR